MAGNSFLEVTMRSGEALTRFGNRVSWRSRSVFCFSDDSKTKCPRLAAKECPISKLSFPNILILEADV